MKTTTLGIRPNCAAYQLYVVAGHMNSPQEPSVDLWIQADGYGREDDTDQLTPAQAREYARMILAAADAAEGLR